MKNILYKSEDTNPSSVSIAMPTYSLLTGDETSDWTRKEQVCHVIRYLKDTSEPSEYFIGIDHAQSTNAEALTTLTVNKFENSNISHQKMTT